MVEKTLSRSEIRRTKRDSDIVAKWAILRREGAKLNAAAESVAELCDVSVSTVNRITRQYLGDAR